MLTDLFSRVLQMSLAGTVTAAVLLIAKSAAGKRLPARWHYAVWFLLLIKLAVPVTIGSPISLFNLFRPASNVYTSGESNNVHGCDLADMVAPVTDEPAADEATNGSLQVNPGGKAAPVKQAGGWVHLGAYIWVTGAGLMLAGIIFSYWRIYRLIERNKTAAPDYLTGIARSCSVEMGTKADVRWVDRLELPFVIGVFNPLIVMPLWVAVSLDEKGLKSVFRHELMHIKIKDHLIRLLLLVLQSLHWFNPVLWLAFAWTMRDCEAACDEAVLQGGSDRTRQEYASVLVAMAQSRSGQSGINPVLAFGESNLKKRVTDVLKNRIYSPAAVSVSVVLLLALAIIMLTGPTNGGQVKVPAPDDSPEASMMDDTDVKGTVNRLLEEIISSGPPLSSNPYKYIKDSRAFDELAALGQPALQQLMEDFAKSNANGLKEYIMACACARIMGIYDQQRGIGTGSGREWYYKYRTIENEFHIVDADYDLFRDASGAPKPVLPSHTDTRSMEDVISNYILAINRRAIRLGEKAIEAHKVYRTEEKNGIINVYLLVRVHWFGFEDGNFTVVSGSGGEPVRIRLRQLENGEYDVLEYRRATDEKGHWLAGMREKFPAAADGETVRQELWEEQVSKAEAYLAEINRADAGITDDVAKNGADNSAAKAIELVALMRPEFPDWPGTREILVRTGGKPPGITVRGVLKTECVPVEAGQYLVALTRTWDITINGVKPEAYWEYRVAGEQVELIKERVNDGIIRTIK